MKRIASVYDLKEKARQRLPRIVFDHLEGGALDEITLQRNRTSFDTISLCQKVLVDVYEFDLSCEIMGRDSALPFFVAPMGQLTLFHPQGDLAVARAIAQAGGVFIHSCWSAISLDQVVSCAGPQYVWEQVFFWSDRNYLEKQVKNAKDLGVEVLVVSGDVNISSKRDRDIHHGIAMPPHPPLRDLIQLATKPRWIWQFLTGPRLTYGNFEVNGRNLRMDEMDSFMEAQKSPRGNWNDLLKLRNSWDGKLILKGVMHPNDAETAVLAGVDGLIVSNHGGRQFDSQRSTIESLAEIVDIVDGRAEVYLDSGIRRGSDILKAISLGARACGIGRAAAFGLAAYGEEGVGISIDILRDEVATALRSVGHEHLNSVGRDLLRWGGVPVNQHPYWDR